MQFVEHARTKWSALFLSVTDPVTSLAISLAAAKDQPLARAPGVDDHGRSGHGTGSVGRQERDRFGDLTVSIGRRLGWTSANDLSGSFLRQHFGAEDVGR
jgi:hypothetical protein